MEPHGQSPCLPAGRHGFQETPTRGEHPVPDDQFTQVEPVVLFVRDRHLFPPLLNFHHGEAASHREEFCLELGLSPTGRNRVIGILLSSIGGLETVFPEAAMELITIIRSASEAVEISFGPLNHLDQFYFR
jgi:hypothetical protein